MWVKDFETISDIVCAANEEKIPVEFICAIICGKYVFVIIILHSR